MRLAWTLALISVCSAAPVSAEDAAPASLPPIMIIGITPVLGTGIERDRVPANVHTLERDDMTGPGVTSLQDAFDRRFGSASTADSVGNPFSSTLSLRGFSASPVLGEPQAWPYIRTACASISRSATSCCGIWCPASRSIARRSFRARIRCSG